MESDLSAPNARRAGPPLQAPTLTNIATSDSPTNTTPTGAPQQRGLTAQIIAFPRRQRAWRVMEMQPGLYRLELLERGSGIIYATAPARYARVRRLLRRSRQGWPVWLQALGAPAVRL